MSDQVEKPNMVRKGFEFFVVAILSWGAASLYGHHGSISSIESDLSAIQGTLKSTSDQVSKDLSSITETLKDSSTQVNLDLKALSKTATEFEAHARKNQEQIETISIKVDTLAKTVVDNNADVNAIKGSLDRMVQKLEQVLTEIVATRSTQSRTLLFKKQTEDGYDDQEFVFLFEYYLRDPDLRALQASSLSSMNARVMNVLDIGSSLACSAELVKPGICHVKVRVLPSENDDPEIRAATVKAINDVLKSGKGLTFALTMSWSSVEI